MKQILPIKLQSILPIEPPYIHKRGLFYEDTTQQEIKQYTEKILGKIKEYYDTQKQPFEEKFLEGIEWVAFEGLINSQKHGISPFSHELFILNNGVCQGFHDNGNFYKREDIKEKIESKTPLAEINLDIPYGRGILYLYLRSNALEVDTRNGILWSAHLRKP